MLPLERLPVPAPVPPGANDEPSGAGICAGCPAGGCPAESPGSCCLARRSAARRMLKKPSEDEGEDVAAVQAATRLRTEVCGSERGETGRGGGLFTEDEIVVEAAGGDKRLRDESGRDGDESWREGEESREDMVIEVEAVVPIDGDISLLFEGDDGREYVLVYELRFGMVGERVCIVLEASWNVRESEGIETDCV